MGKARDIIKVPEQETAEWRGSRSWICRQRSEAGNQGISDRLLVHVRPGLDPSGPDQMDTVAIAAHDARSGGDVIGDDEIAALAGKLGLALGNHVAGFSGKADDEARAPRRIAGDGAENVGIFDQGE